MADSQLPGAMGAIAKTLEVGRLGSWNDKVR
jgi:hypothetical protein